MISSRMLCVISCLFWVAACQKPSHTPWQPPPVSEKGAFASGAQPTRLRITNLCEEPLWIQHVVGSGATERGELLGPSQIHLAPGQSHDYPVPGGRVEATRFWPKTGCDADGLNCTTGQSSPPCPDQGCMPPMESKFEATFADTACTTQDYRCMTYWNASQVDGFTLPISIFPKGAGVQPPGTPGAEQCVESRCDALDLQQCPDSELIDGRSLDLRVFASQDRSRVVGCMSPCKAHNYPPPYGLGLPENEGDGLMLCCPEGVTPTQCREGPVSKTRYVQYVNRVCPNVYAYSYDDDAGLHKCPAATQYEVVFCGSATARPLAPSR